jgi:hypothetical protein
MTNMSETRCTTHTYPWPTYLPIFGIYTNYSEYCVYCPSSSMMKNEIFSHPDYGIFGARTKENINDFYIFFWGLDPSPDQCSPPHNRKFALFVYNSISHGIASNLRRTPSMAMVLPSSPWTSGLTHVLLVPIIICSSTCIFNDYPTFSIHFPSLFTALTTHLRRSLRDWMRSPIRQSFELNSSTGNLAHSIDLASFRPYSSCPFQIWHLRVAHSTRTLSTPIFYLTATGIPTWNRLIRATRSLFVYVFSELLIDFRSRLTKNQ